MCVHDFACVCACVRMFSHGSACGHMRSHVVAWYRGCWVANGGFMGPGGYTGHIHTHTHIYIYIYRTSRLHAQYVQRDVTQGSLHHQVRYIYNKCVTQGTLQHDAMYIAARRKVPCSIVCWEYTNGGRRKVHCSMMQCTVQHAARYLAAPCFVYIHQARDTGYLAA